MARFVFLLMILLATTASATTRGFNRGFRAGVRSGCPQQRNDFRGHDFRGDIRAPGVRVFIR